MVWIILLPWPDDGQGGALRGHPPGDEVLGLLPGDGGKQIGKAEIVASGEEGLGLADAQVLKGV